MSSKIRPSFWGRLLPKFCFGHGLDTQSIPYKDNIVPPDDPVFIMSVKDTESEEHDYFYMDQVRKVKRNKQFFLRPIGTFDDSLKMICSCDGLLVFDKSSWKRKLYILNPVINGHEGIIAIPATNSPSYICGFFFHPLTGDYRVLSYMVSGSEHAHCFVIFSLQTKSWRLLTGSIRYDPVNQNFINANGTLHWMTYHNPVQLILGPYAYKIPCSHSILRFNILTEKFDAMPHPDYKYCSRRGVMRLLKMDGQLCLGHVQRRCIDLWVLEDYSEWKWVKKYQVSLQWHPKPKFCPDGSRNRIDLVSIQNGELWIHWISTGLFAYNLESGILRKIITYTKKEDRWKYLTFIPYTKTLVSLNSFDEMIDRDSG